MFLVEVSFSQSGEAWIIVDSASGRTKATIAEDIGISPSLRFATKKSSGTTSSCAHQVPLLIDFVVARFNCTDS